MLDGRRRHQREATLTKRDDEKYADRYLVQYSVYGPDLNVDELLSEVAPGADHEVWHRGDARGPKRVSKTAGVRIQVAEAGRVPEVIRNIESFLEEESGFLTAAARRRGGDVYSVLSCAMWIYAKVPTSIWLERPILRRLADLGVDWEVTGYPCAEDDGP